MEFSKVKIEVYTPEESLEKLIEKLDEVGACKVGKYSYVSSYSQVKGTWKPEDGANPYNGEVNKISRGSEYRLEVRCSDDNVAKAIAAIKKYHPYEEPVINIVPLLNDIWHIN